MKTEQIELTEHEALTVLHALEHSMLRELRAFENSESYLKWCFEHYVSIHRRIYSGFPHLQDIMRK